jgi:tetratricopeptide (TPR) repeat protein
MGKFKLFKNHKFNIAVGISLASIAVLFEVVIPTTVAHANKKAHILLTRAQRESSVHPNQAIINLRVAHTLAPSNQTIIQHLADLYVKQNRSNDAIKILKKLPKEENGLKIALIYLQTGQLTKATHALSALNEAEPNILLAKSRLQLEQGRVGEAANLASRALSLDPTSAQYQIQLGLCYIIAGQLATSTHLLSSSEALHSLNRAQLGKTALAYELSSQGLLRSARSVIITKTELTAYDHLILGRINYSLGQNDSSKLGEAQNNLVKATQADPANIEAHRWLEKVLIKTGDIDGAKKQQELIKQLESGKV